MNLQICTLIAMLEAYSDLGILEKMEKMYAKVLNANVYIKDYLIRKMANVYIQHCRFPRLDEFGNEIGSKNGRTELVWCILLLSAVGLSSKRGINSIKQEMVRGKMRDFKALNAVFSEAMKQRVEPDIIMVGILFDACSVGYNCKYVLEKWRSYGWLEETAEMRTDPLVMSAFGKGSFILKCEEVYTSLGSKAKEKKIWKYDDLIKLFFV
ncbi:pentatricopeptide repeat-containing protein At4g14190, chloroplastic-like [Phalaenopsis equestris]|uniref:pentatricopeptide repeat-containing protein At4g14190, chloroplastic-like n=1 Tax=Phalaenopsis equestris TaxID=78828 RepID=UPI0009E1B367|nr:pentatricopeptide repeat-containing protein At4g14190, chloroplastic-like [Phalaenopsis equestris]